MRENEYGVFERRRGGRIGFGFGFGFGEWEGNNTYGSEGFICVCFHGEQTRLYLLVAEQRRIEFDAHDLGLAVWRMILRFILQVHSLPHRTTLI